LAVLWDDRQAQLEGSSGVANGDQGAAAPHSVLLCPGGLRLWIGRLHESAPKASEASQGVTEQYLALDVSSLLAAYFDHH